MRRVVAFAVCAIVGVGCTDNSTNNPPMAPHLRESDVAAIPPTMVATPAGLVPRKCVAEVPRGAKLHRDGTIENSDGSLIHLPAGCAAKAARRLAVVPPGDTGWVEYSLEYAGVSHTFREIDAVWMVPSDPDSSFNTSQTFYAFPAVEDSQYVIQPVLQYGYNQEFGGNYWSLAGWWAGGGPYSAHSTPIYVSPGDTIVGKIVPTLCAGGACDWDIYAIDQRTRDTTVLTGVDFPDDFNRAYGGVEEMYDLKNCGQYPWGGVRFTSIALYQDNGLITPSWAAHANSNGPACGFGVDTSSTTTFLADSSAPYQLVADGIDGPTQVDSGTVGTWYANLDHEGEPTYTWWWTGLVDESGSTAAATVTQSGYLTLHVVDQVPDTAVDSIFVTACLTRLHNCPEIVRR